jgi:chitin disaccharide deacetylase
LDFLVRIERGRKIDAETAYRQIFAAIPEGLTYLSLHFNAPGDFEAVEPDQAYIRTEEYAAFKSGLVEELVSSHGLEVIGMREVRERLRAARAGQ